MDHDWAIVALVRAGVSVRELFEQMVLFVLRCVVVALASCSMGMVICRLVFEVKSNWKLEVELRSGTQTRETVLAAGFTATVRSRADGLQGSSGKN